ncbi:MAG TPA: hypothetical protein VMU58_12395, partial [Gaiellaceae bacterium]|nr:hypothetical protein [Gaiellaceae bacterium]
MKRIRVGWLAPEDCTLPPGAYVESITNVSWQLASRLAGRCDLVLATRDHPTLGASDAELDGIRYMRRRAVADVRRGAAVELLNKAQRKLRVPDPPYAGRPSYFRGYARNHAEGFRREAVDVVHLSNTSQWVPILRAA